MHKEHYVPVEENNCIVVPIISNFDTLYEQYSVTLNEIIQAEFIVVNLKGTEPPF